MRFIDYSADLWAGRDAPWLPAAGLRANISLADASLVDYDTPISGPSGPFDEWWNGYGQYRSWPSMVSAWSGGILCPEYGTHGAVVDFGGGHGGNQGVFAHLFDFAATERRWSQIGAPDNLPADFSWAGFLSPPASTYTAGSDQRDATWRDYPFNGGHIKLLDHTYNTVVYVSPAEGGGPKGSLLVPQAPLTQNPSDAPGYWCPHLLSLDTGRMTRAMTTPPAGSPGFNDNNATVAVKDTTRSRVWYFRQSSTTAWYQDLSSGPPYSFAAHVVQKASGGTMTDFMSALQSDAVYVPEADAVVIFKATDTPQVNGPLSFRIFDMSTGVPIALQRTGLPTQPMPHGGMSPSCCWVPPQQAFYIYEGLGDDFCHVLRPSSLDFANCSWAWSREQFGGVAPVSRFPSLGLMTTLQASYRRMCWVPSLGRLAWRDGPNVSGVCVDGVTRDGVVQLWCPPGVVME